MQSTGNAVPEAAASDAADPGTAEPAIADSAVVSGFFIFFFFNVRSFGWVSGCHLERSSRKTPAPVKQLTRASFLY
jgi:hypothetical protein